MTVIDANNKVFTIFRCFVPSKEAHSYNWTLRIAFKNLDGELVISFNQCISSNTEEAMYVHIHRIHNISCITKSHYRLDTFHLLKKEWKGHVIAKVSGDDLKNRYITIYVR